MISRPGQMVARLGLLVIAAYLLQVAALLDRGDRLILGVEPLDARPLFAAAALAGLVYAVAHRSELVRNVWLVLLTLAAWGRALSLLLIGSPMIARDRELVGFTSWAVVFFAGLFAALILTASAILDARSGR